MSELGDVFELMHGARHRFRTVRATIREWRDLTGGQRAVDRLKQERRAAHGGEPLRSGGAVSEEIDMRLRVWLEPPERAREEREGGLEAPSLSIRDGARWWRYSADAGAISDADATSAGGGVANSVAHLFDPAPLIGALEFEPRRRRKAAGREAIEVLARPRAATPENDFALFTFGVARGADAIELIVDAERGVLLRLAARSGGEDLSITEVLEVDFDEEFAPETFVFAPPVGEVVRSPRPGRPRRVTLEEAARLASFPVLILRRLPPGWRTTVHWFAGDERPRMPPRVTIHYRAEDASHKVLLSETGVSEPDEMADVPWVQREGMRVWEPRGGGEAHVQIERDGTRVRLTSDLSVSALLELTRSLVRAPGEPPRFIE